MLNSVMLKHWETWKRDSRFTDILESRIWTGHLPENWSFEFEVILFSRKYFCALALRLGLQ